VKQVVQAISGGPVRVLDVPRPTIGATEVLVETVASVISPGTERAVTELARSGLVSKARARPDLVRQVVRKARSEGIARTAETVRARLAGDLPLGYSAAGIALQVGEAVTGVLPGQLVATGGAGKANHAEFQAVPGLLCVPVPDGVPAPDAAFATITSIALHGLRLAEVGPGARVVVVGLGLVGQLAMRLALAAGCQVAGIDVSHYPVERAGDAGGLCLVEAGEDTTAAVWEWSRGQGADAVLVTAAGRSSAPVLRSPALCRDRATVVVIGDVGLDLQRPPLYGKELCLRFARSYGPGRYERSYEEWAVDYPAGHVRWTEGRNLEASLDLLAGHRLRVDDLVTHRFSIDDAVRAYDLIERRSEPYLALQLTYPEAPLPELPVRVSAPRRSTSGAPGVGLIGAGAFPSTVLVPALAAAGFNNLASVASASGLSAIRLAERVGFAQAVSGADAVINDPNVEVVVIATPHDDHARLAARALRAGKHVWCEKPLALSIEELDDVEDAWRTSGRTLFVGFNRRWSPAVAAASSHLAEGFGPLVVTYRVNAGTVPKGHWYADRRQGGRLLGEACHFVDTCEAIVGQPAQRAIAVGHLADAAHGDAFVIALDYPDGSSAAITYAAGGDAATSKERIEVLGRGRSVVTDFASVELDHRIASLTSSDKGHLSAARAFYTAVASGAHVHEGVSSSRSTLRAGLALTTLTLRGPGSVG